MPTARSLGLVSLPDLPVRREGIETASVYTRVAESFNRVGNFEAFSPPESAYFLGGGQQGPDYEGLRISGEWTVKRVLKLKTVDLDAGDAWGNEMRFEVARQNARMVAAWQAY